MHQPIRQAIIAQWKLNCLLQQTTCPQFPTANYDGAITIISLSVSLTPQGDIAQWLMRRNSNPKTLHGFDPLAGQGEKQSFCSPSESTLVQTCLCLTPLRLYGTHPHRAHVKDPMSMCRKRGGLTAGGMETRKALHTGSNPWVAPYCGCSLPPGKAARIFRCITLGQESRHIKSNQSPPFVGQ